MRSPENTLEGSGDLTVKVHVDNVDSHLSQTVAFLVVAEMMSGLMAVELCCGLKRLLTSEWQIELHGLLNVANPLCALIDWNCTLAVLLKIKSKSF